MMFDSGIPGFGISVTFIVTLAVAMGGLLLWLVTYLLRLRRRGAVSGRELILSGTGVAMESFIGDGRVWLEGEAWAARSKVSIDKDQQVSISGMNGLVLDVEPITSAQATDAQTES